MFTYVWTLPRTIALICLFHFLTGSAQTIPDSLSPNFDQANNIRAYLSGVAADITHNSLAAIKTLEEWEAEKAQRHAEFLEMMGLQDKPFKGKRSPLNITRTGVIQKETYRIEKLYYESLPNLYVAANLYVPEGVKGPMPAILYVCGHAHTQKHNYQAHAKTFAKNGFVCLIIETIQRGEVKGEHLGAESLGWFHWYSRGYNPGGVEMWNGIRAIDLLSQLPEVDPERIGVTGISGGGSQSWYLAAADSRVKAAAAVAGAGSLAGQVGQRTLDDHCDCMMPINTYCIDFSDVGALIAPRPFMIAQTQGDGYYSIEAVRTLYEKMKPVYTHYGKLPQLRLEEAPGGHSYGSNDELRPVVLSFFLKELRGIDIPPDKLGPIETAKEFSEEALRVYVAGAPKNDRTRDIQDSFVALAKPPEIKTAQQLIAYRKEVKGFLQKKTFHAFPKEPVNLDMRKEFQTDDFAKHKKEVYSFVSEPGWRLKFSLQRNHAPEEQEGVLLVLKNPNETRWASNALTHGLGGKLNIAYFEARGIGETGWAPSLQWHIRRAAAWTGRTVASMRVYDVLRCLEVLRQLPGIDPDKIYLAAQGEMAAIATYAALLDGNIHSLILKDPPATQNEASQPDGRGLAIEMLNCLRITDLAQVTGLMFPKAVIAIGTLPETYSWTENLYKDLDKAEGFVRVEKLSDWVE